jgi:flavin reductase (DIM6/NTAB) family NADH-FMN oxidoreductase RutF
MSKMDKTALFKIGYGLYLVTTRDGEKDNGVILNSVMQITDAPNRIAVCINRANLSCETVKKTGIMNVCPLSEKTPFSFFENFGMKSGRDADKFEGTEIKRTENGLAYEEKYSNAVISLKVENSVEFESHVMFICTIEEAQNLSDDSTATYDYYHKNIKPKPNAQAKKGYVCTICGFVYEGESLPEDYVCPLCLHGAEYFEPLS